MQRIFLLAVGLFLALGSLQAQERPKPYPVFLPKAFQQAVERGTRTLTGEPGPNYWMNEARYVLEAVLSPDRAWLSGKGRLTYINHAPDTLKYLVLHLRQNLHTPGNIRNRQVSVTGGMKLTEVRVEGQPLAERRRLNGVGYAVEDTRMYVYLPEPLAPGDSVQLSLSWGFEIPGPGNPRMGQDGEVFFLGYWYPQFAVYDDLEGWRADPYMGNGEFYMGYADYDVRITVPDAFLVGATGELVNPEEVLTPVVRARLERAAQADSIVHVVTAEERGVATVGSPTGLLTWHFRARHVRDFAFGASAAYVWDATAARTGEGTALIHAFYRPGAEVWEAAATYGRFAIEDLSRRFLPYPWPHMTIMEGIIRGGMEYPMVTLIGGRERSPYSLFRVTYHEIGHMWFPMIVGQDEKRYAWMDEGLTSFNTNEGARAFFPDADPWNPVNHSYFFLAGTDEEVEIMRHSDLYPPGSPARVVASYDKPSLVLHALRHMVGEEAFWRAYRTYARRWAFKHPTPWDFFHTFEQVLGRDLDWFWTSWFFETWTLDQAISSVEVGEDSTVVTIEDRGLVPMPVLLEVTFADGSRKVETLSEERWLKGHRKATVTFRGRSPDRLAIDPGFYFPDANRENNYWERRR